MANFIKFLGTAGARIVVARQLRSSAGIWLSLDGSNIYIDPGPGALAKCFAARPKLDPMDLDAILLSHNHLDHAGDVNAMIEAMTLGGHKKKGTVFAPISAFEGDPIILKYVRKYLDKTTVLKEKGKYKVGSVSFETPVKHVHGIETFGFKFKGKGATLSYISDTRFFDDMHRYYKSDILIISVLKDKPSNLDHLCVDDVEKILKEIRPKTAILTHFGRFMLDAGPEKMAARLSRDCNTRVIAARDGMTFKF